MAPSAGNQAPKTTNGSGESTSKGASTEKPPASLLAGSTLSRLAGIGVLLLGVVGAFLYLGGWFSPQKLTPARFVDEFQRVNGTHSGFRRNHAKGVCVRGFFDSNGQGTRLSKAVVFRSGRVPVIGRFSLGNGDPYAKDELSIVRGLGLQFSLPDGEEWRTAMVNLPVFPFKDAQAFYDNLVASQPDPATHQPDPAKGAAFLASNPETARALGIIKAHAPSSGFGNSTFYGLNAFLFTNADGATTPVRWTLMPVQPFEPAGATAASQDKNFLFDGLIANILQHPLQWHLILTVGQPGDPTNDATIPWPEGREQVDVGTVTLDSVESEETSPARDINFDPLVLPAGMAPSDDPLLSARSAIYSQSFTRRAGEKKEPSAITPAEVRK
ncbi:MAG TPA: catalase family peroxidase [Candidatus Acidoferrales bacterium]|jgi:catalase|nr:catalase family peroxidase [Candidatus Acidoferrales bacterium]